MRTHEARNRRRSADDGGSRGSAWRWTIALLAIVIGVSAVATQRSARSRVGWGDGAHPAAPLRVDLNRASPGELAALPGIGPTMAERIVQERTARGAFTEIGQLERVHGIGPRTIERLAPHVALSK